MAFVVHTNEEGATDAAGSSPGNQGGRKFSLSSSIPFRANQLIKSCPFFIFLPTFIAPRSSFMGSVQLPIVAVCSQQTGLQADLRTSLRFCNHSSDDAAISSTDDIIRLRKDERLWVIPAAGCRLRVSLRLLGRVSGHGLAMNEVARWVEKCDVCECTSEGQTNWKY